MRKLTTDWRSWQSKPSLQHCERYVMITFRYCRVLQLEYFSNKNNNSEYCFSFILKVFDYLKLLNISLWQSYIIIHLNTITLYFSCVFIFNNKQTKRSTYILKRYFGYEWSMTTVIITKITL